MGTVTVTNMGPLLTTFTAPASCTTGRELLKIASSESIFVDAWFNQCGSQVLMGTLKECWPSGAATVDEFVSRNYRNPTTGLLGYYSPGIACPAGWTTAGVTTRNTDGSPGSASGAFSLPAPTITRPDYLDFIPGFAQIIDPGETAAVCCPRCVFVTNTPCSALLPSTKQKHAAADTHSCLALAGPTRFCRPQCTNPRPGRPSAPGAGSMTARRHKIQHSPSMAMRRRLRSCLYRRARGWPSTQRPSCQRRRLTWSDGEPLVLSL